MFCKNFHSISCIHYSSLLGECAKCDLEDSCNGFMTEEIKWYILLRAVEKFNEKFPNRKSYDEKLSEFQEIIKSTQIECNSKAEIKEDYAMEMLRHNGLSIATTSAFLGGIAGQEVVKMITQKFIPVNNTLVYNGICSMAQMYEIK